MVNTLRIAPCMQPLGCQRGRSTAFGLFVHVYMCVCVCPRPRKYPCMRRNGVRALQTSSWMDFCFAV
jgi:hypothetical protein